MKLQNHFTTPEQSKRLLELGVPKNTADMYAVKNATNDGYSNPRVLTIPYEQKELRIHNILPSPILSIPIWSVGRLMEITGLFAPRHIVDWTFDLIETTYIEGVVAVIENLIENYDVDFSKLEEML